MCGFCPLDHMIYRLRGLLIGKQPSTVCLISGGLVILVCAGLYEVRTSRDALFPPSSFKNLTTSEPMFYRLLSSDFDAARAVIILIINFLHNFVFTAGTFYLALYFQVCVPLILTFEHLIDARCLLSPFKVCGRCMPA